MNHGEFYRWEEFGWEDFCLSKSSCSATLMTLVKQKYSNYINSTTHTSKLEVNKCINLKIALSCQKSKVGSFLLNKILWSSIIIIVGISLQSSKLWVRNHFLKVSFKLLMLTNILLYRKLKLSLIHAFLLQIEAVKLSFLKTSLSV